MITMATTGEGCDSHPSPVVAIYVKFVRNFCKHSIHEDMAVYNGKRNTLYKYEMFL